MRKRKFVGLVLPAEGFPSPGLMRRQVFSLAWPSVSELFLTSLCQMVNMMMVGVLGPWGIAAVGLNTQPRFLMLACFVALNIGSTALVARFRGMKDQKSANLVLRQTLLLTLITSAAIGAIGFACAPYLITFMGSDAITHEPAVAYFRVQMAGFPFIAMPLAVTAALRGVGNTRASMVLNLLANALNVTLNFLLITGRFGMPALGVPGASVATVVGSIVATVCGFTILYRSNHYIYLRAKDSFRPNWPVIKRILRIGAPAMGEQIVMRGGILIFTLIASSLGTNAFAAHQIALNLLSMSFMTGQGFGIAATTLMGQCLGMKRPELAKLYVRTTQRMGIIVSLGVTALLFFGRFFLVSLYTSDLEVMAYGAQVMTLVALIQPFQNAQLSLTGALRGAGDTRSTMWILCVCILLIRPPLSYVGTYWLSLGLIGAWIGAVADQLMRTLLISLRFRSGKWGNIKV